MKPTVNPADQLRDIKPPVPIDDWSMYAYWGLIVSAILLVGVALYVAWRIWRKTRRTNRRREALESLKRIDWHDPKRAAYAATTYGRMFLDALTEENPRLHELYAQMISELEAYKYRKTVDPLDPKARTQFDLFVKACDESL
jgi:ABC-type nickel/cobalt efflux system permease component RcnA